MSDNKGKGKWWAIMKDGQFVIEPQKGIPLIAMYQDKKLIDATLVMLQAQGDVYADCVIALIGVIDD